MLALVGLDTQQGVWRFAYTFNGKSINDRANRFAFSCTMGQSPMTFWCVICATTRPVAIQPICLRVPHQDNVDDMMRKGRRVKGGTYRRDGYERGEQHHAARLAESDVRAMRQDRAGGLSLFYFGQIRRPYRARLAHRQPKGVEACMKNGLP